MSNGIIRTSNHRDHLDKLPWRDLIDAACSGIMAIDRLGTIVVFNKAAEKIFCLEDRPFLNEPVEKLIPALWMKLREFLDIESPEIGKEIVIGNLRVIMNLAPIIVENRSIGLMSVFQDTTEIERTAMQLPSVKRLVDQLDAIFESSYDGLHITDGSGNILRVNRSFEKITGVAGSEVIGRNLMELEREGFISESVTLRVLETGTAATVKARTRGGRYTLSTGSPIYDAPGKISMVVTNVRDMTDLNHLNHQLRQSMRATEDYQLKLEKLKIQQQDDSGVVARSKEMVDVLDIASRVANVDTPVLIQGETGAGKEVIARLIHGRSARAEKGIFVKINCAAIPDNLLESELFGYEKGAFTGANHSGKKGLFELADDGTLFLDEIEALPLNLQAKLLSALQDFEITRVGGVISRHINTRVITASNQDLYDMVKDKAFREDLYFRLNVIPLYIPPLRKRKDDVLPLINYYLEKYNEKYKKSNMISRSAIDCLFDYNWPGNVRELSNTIERLVVLSNVENVLLADLPLEMKSFRGKSAGLDVLEIKSLKHAVARFEHDLIEETIQRLGNAKRAAAFLEIDAATVSRKMRK